MGNSIIFNTIDLRVIPEVMEMIKKTKAPGIDLKEVELFLYKNVIRSDTKLWVSFDGNKFTGFLLAYLVYPAIKPEVFVAWVYVSSQEERLGEDFMRLVERWARNLKITKISAMVHNNLKAFQTKYGFKLKYYGVEKEIDLNKEAA